MKNNKDQDIEEFFSSSRLKKNLTLKDLKKAEEESYDLP